MKKFENAEIKIVSLDHSDDILTNSTINDAGYDRGTGEIDIVDWL